KRVVPADTEVGAVDGRGQVQADPIVPPRISDRGGHGAGHGDRLGDALDRQLAADGDVAVAVEADLGRAEAQLGVPLGVEEVRRLEMRRQVLVLDVHAGDLGRPLERGALVLDGQPGADLVELALEGAGQVRNLEADARVNGVETPSAGRGDGQDLSAHGRFGSSLALCIIEYAKTLPDIP